MYTREVSGFYSTSVEQIDSVRDGRPADHLSWSSASPGVDSVDRWNSAGQHGGPRTGGPDCSGSNQRTNFKAETVSGPTGEFRISSIPVGPYVIRVTKDGFESYKQEGFVLSVGQVATLSDPPDGLVQPAQRVVVVHLKRLLWKAQTIPFKPLSMKRSSKACP